MPPNTVLKNMGVVGRVAEVYHHIVDTYGSKSSVRIAYDRNIVWLTQAHRSIDFMGFGEPNDVSDAKESLVLTRQMRIQKCQRCGDTVPSTPVLGFGRAVARIGEKVFPPSRLQHSVTRPWRLRPSS